MKRLITTMAIALVAATAVRADVLALWENDDLTTTNLTATADTVHADLSSSTMDQLIGSADGWNDTLGAIQNAAGVNSLATAITAGDYFTFTITPNAGKVVSYSDAFLRYSVGANVRPATTVFTLMSSLTGFTSADAIGTVSASLPVDASVVGTGTFDLTGASALQSVAAGTAVEFRLYAHNTDANAMTRVSIGHLFATNGTDDFVLNGTVVPEPATLGLLGFAAAGMLWVRRKFAI